MIIIYARSNTSSIPLKRTFIAIGPLANPALRVRASSSLALAALATPLRHKYSMSVYAILHASLSGEVLALNTCRPQYVNR